MIKYWLVFGICCLGLSCLREEGKQYFSDGRFYPEYKHGYSISNLFRLTSDSVFDNDNKPMAIKIPVGIKFNSSAWGRIYSGAAGKTKWDLNFIISDFDSLYSQIFFDKNKNLDFRDDTAIAIQKDSVFAVAFKNPQDQKAEYRYHFRFYHGPVDSSYQKMYCIMNLKRRDTLSATYMLCTNSFKIKKIRLANGNIISLIDVDCDGMFTGKNDKIIAGDLEENPTLIKKPLQCKDVKYGVELPFANNTYEFFSANKYGDHIYLKALNKIVDTIERLTSITYTDENGDSKILQMKSDKKYSVFYIWGTWCIGCQYQSKGFAEIMNDHKGEADFYTLNVGDKRQRMIKYISDKKFPFQPYQVSNETAEHKFFAEAFPTFIVADKENKIILRTSYVGDVRKYFEQESSKK